MMFNNLGLCIRPRRRPIMRRYFPALAQSGGPGNDIFVNSINSQPGPPGPAGVSVVSAKVSPNPGDLYIYLSDGTTINAGNVIGPQGNEGPVGPSGPIGPIGPEGNCNFFNVTLVDDDYIIDNADTYVGALEKNIEITLPTGVTGRVFYIKNQSNGNIKVVGTGGETIDGSSFQTLGSNGNMIVVFDGFRWNIT